MSRTVSIDEMDNAIMEELEKYADLAADELKAAVKETAASVRKDIQAGAPVDTGKYKKSWSVKNVRACGAFEEPLPDRAPLGAWPRQARRRPCCGKASYRLCRAARK